MADIDLGKLSERDLMVLTVTAVNRMSLQLDALNGSVRSHEKRLVALEPPPPRKGLPAPSQRL